MSLPASHRALQLESKESGFQVRVLATPQPTTGTAIVAVCSAAILPYHGAVYSGKHPVQYPTPLVGGFSAIGRIAAVGPDATILAPGQLVYVDCVVRARDSPDEFFLSAISDGLTPGGRKLMAGAWRDGTFAEFVAMPLENCIPLNEAKLCQVLGYSPQDLACMAYMLVPYAGLRDIRLEAGETIVICPATGFYSSLAVQVAITMGASVIALGRSEDKLKALAIDIHSRYPLASMETVCITGDEAKDTAAIKTLGTVDAVLDITPSAASGSTHTRSAIKSLRRGGRISVMASTKNIAVSEILLNGLTVKGKMMYERDAVIHFVKMLEAGLFPKNGNLVKTTVFGLDEWKDAFSFAAENNGIGQCVVFKP
ncbi:uncharacterized protein LMH87_008633 [Akanthomyces muscarius]|uniref:Alcohol dehydrogenase-like N-terminal domain-containing protein n=1 Tax=Akanthomyces muscarius TaxID=2231603 RepID=A0A9W8QJ27_AKAMU|nr:uncharacterized protein LMH87_008633 [Akanthomyces muscarius]KAJ4158089.1 hypothetical protein LMH87_008633 [Akanthomyces muscarius]